MLYCTSRKSDGFDLYFIKLFFQFSKRIWLGVDCKLQSVTVTRNTGNSADRKQLDRFEQVIRNFIAQNFFCIFTVLNTLSKYFSIDLKLKFDSSVGNFHD